MRLELSKTSIKKYEAMTRTVCRDGRVHGTLQFGGASRTFRWAGRLVQLQNVPQNHLPDLKLARDIVKHGDEEQLELLFGSVPGTLSELIRTAFIPRDGCRFIAADFSAIEARVLAWLPERNGCWRSSVAKAKSMRATASRMFHIPQEDHRQRASKLRIQAEGEAGSFVLRLRWRSRRIKGHGSENARGGDAATRGFVARSNPHIVQFWNALGNAASEVIEKHNGVRVGKVKVYWRGQSAADPPAQRTRSVLPLAAICGQSLRQPGASDIWRHPSMERWSCRRPLAARS